MVQAIINISDDANRVLNIVKAKYGLKDKSAAIDKIVKAFGEEILEPDLRPEFIERAKEIDRQPPIRIGTIENIRKRYG